MLGEAAVRNRMPAPRLLRCEEERMLFDRKHVAARIDGEDRFGDVGFQDDATEFAYGAGIRLRLNNFGIHAEYEKLDTDVVDDLDLITVGATHSFGRGTDRPPPTETTWRPS
jgi:hypothetical protein